MAGMTAVLGGPVASGAQRSTMPLCSMSQYGLKAAPKSWNAGCVGASPTFTRLRWTGWGTPRARATGTAEINLCEPTCADGNYRKAKATLTVFRRVPCKGTRMYSRVKVRYGSTSGTLEMYC